MQVACADAVIRYITGTERIMLKIFNKRGLSHVFGIDGCKQREVHMKLTGSVR